jgi:hypothetical protein
MSFCVLVVIGELARVKNWVLSVLFAALSGGLALLLPRVGKTNMIRL